MIKTKAMKNLYKNLTAIIVLNLITISSYSQYNNAFRIKITGNGYSDETVVRMVNGATSGFDGMYDAWKLFSPNPNVPSLYTEIAPGQELSINSLPEYTEDKSVVLYTNIPVSGSYTIEVEEVYPLNSNYKVSLTDMTSNLSSRLMGDTSMTFNLVAQQNVPTFTFNISTPLSSTVTDESCTSMNDGAIEINNPGNNDWNLEITNNGDNAVISSTTVNSSTSTISALNPGSYKATVTSLGIVDEINFTVNPAVLLTAEFNIDKDTVYLSEGGIINLTNTSQNALVYDWDMGDGGISNLTDPNYTYTSVGDYTVSLTSSNVNCTVQSSKSVTVLLSPTVITSINDNNITDIKLANFGNGNYQLSTADYKNKKISVYDLKGSLIFEDNFNNNNYNLSLTNNSSGIYIVNVMAEDGKIFRQKLVK